MWHTYLRLLKYIGPYKKRFFIGILLAFSLSLFNGLSLTALKPVFDILGTAGQKPFQVVLEKKDVKLLVELGHEERLRKLFAKSDEYKAQLKLLNNKIFEKKEQSTMSTWKKMRSIPAEKFLWLNEQLIDVPPSDVLLYTCLGILPIYLLRLLSLLGTVFFISSTGLLAVKDMRRDLYGKLQTLPLTFFLKEKTGNLMSRIINDVTLVSESISHELRVSINNMFLIVTHVIILTLISYKLVIICMIGVPIVLWPVNYFAKRVKETTANEQTALAEMNGHLQEVISGIRVIRAFGMEDYEAGRFAEINNRMYRQNFRFRVYHTFGPALVELATSAIIIGLLLYGGMKVIGGDFSAGSFLTFLFTLIIILSPIKQMATWFNLVNRTVAAGERVFEIIDADSEVVHTKHPVKMGRLEKSIAFKKFSFAYEDEKVLKNISLDVPIGSTIALVGHSGAGKTTMVDLLPRFYDVTAGSIQFDQIDIRDIELKELRSKIGVVTQDVFLFNGSIKENISYGRTDLSEKQIISAAKLAYAHEFIVKMPLGYDSIIGERGMTLSGGQRQRVSIARALLKDPEILILDEATSALDTQSERLVQKALEKLMKNRTTFVIAHRLSTIFQADLILVLQKGRIVEKGTHKELLKKKGHYHKLYQMQFS